MKLQMSCVGGSLKEDKCTTEMYDQLTNTTFLILKKNLVRNLFFTKGWNYVMILRESKNTNRKIYKKYVKIIEHKYRKVNKNTIQYNTIQLIRKTWFIILSVYSEISIWKNCWWPILIECTTARNFTNILVSKL